MSFKAPQGWTKTPKWHIKSDLDYFIDLLRIQIDLKEDVDEAILAATKTLQTPAAVENMTVKDIQSFLNNIGYCLEDLIHHEKKFKKYCEEKIKET